MYFEDITGDSRLWAVRFEGETDNELYRLFDQWSDIEWLREFFKANLNDLAGYFKITDINQAISDTLEDGEVLEAIMMDLSPDIDLDMLFRPLDNNRTIADILEKEKAKLGYTHGHDSWLRIYAIKLADGNYIVTGGAIKLTLKMEERPHTAKELKKIERVRRFLIQEGIVDHVGFIEYTAEF